MLQFVQTTAWFLAGAAIAALFQYVSRSQWTVGYTARPAYAGLPRLIATLARVGAHPIPVPDVLPRRVPGFTLFQNPVIAGVHVTPTPRIPWWRRLRDSFREDFIEHHGTRFLEWFLDSPFVAWVAGDDLADAVVTHWEFDEWWQTVWATNEYHEHHGAHRREDVDVPGSDWRSQWAEYVTQDWPTLASSADDIWHPTDEHDLLRPVICTSRVNDVLRVSPLVGSTSC